MGLTDTERELYRKSKYFFSLRQEILYGRSNFLRYKWYRRLYGGTWRLLHLLKGTEYNRLFCVWTKVDLNDEGEDCWSGYHKVLEEEVYPETSVLTRWDLFKEFFKQLFTKKNDKR